MILPEVTTPIEREKKEAVQSGSFGKWLIRFGIFALAYGFLWLYPVGWWGEQHAWPKTIDNMLAAMCVPFLTYYVTKIVFYLVGKPIAEIRKQGPATSANLNAQVQAMKAELISRGV